MIAGASAIIEACRAARPTRPSRTPLRSRPRALRPAPYPMGRPAMRSGPAPATRSPASCAARACSRCSCSSARLRALYGNRLIDGIAELSGGLLAVNPNTMYPLLRSLEERALVTGYWEHPERRSRRFYAITPAGEHERERLRDEVVPRLDAVAASVERPARGARPVSRARASVAISGSTSPTPKSSGTTTAAGRPSSTG